jgi:hypothetical protein
MAKSISEQTPEERDARKELRDHLLASPAVRTSKLVQWKGKTFEVRAPSMKQQRRLSKISLEKDGSRDDIKSLSYALIECVYVPGTDVQVLEVADIAAMEERSVDDFVGAFAKALKEVGEMANADEIEKNL